MKLALKIILLSILVYSCSVKKDSAKKKIKSVEAKDVNTEIVRSIQEKRKGGKITTEIIPVEKRERDENGELKELIETIKDGGLTKTVIYRPDGKVDVECTADEIYRLIKEKIKQQDNSIVKEEVKEKQKQKEEKFNPAPFIFGLIGLAIILLVGFFIMRRVIEKSLVKKLNS
jgi:hypothetical protein